jgi:hypothetical protein
MSAYPTADEDRIRTAALAREWMRSGLLDAVQLASIDAGLRTDVKRTNAAFRAVLFLFGCVAIGAATGFFLEAFKVSDRRPVAWSLIAAGVICFLLAEYLVFRFRLYRFGVEEACAFGAVVLVSGSAGVLANVGDAPGNFPMFALLVTAAILSCVVYVRFGYLYSALGATACAAVAPFFIESTASVDRLLSATVLLVVLIVARSLRRPHGDDFPGDDYGAIQSAAWLGLYLVLNLELPWSRYLGLGFDRSGRFATDFYWATYAAIWLLPATGLYLGLRDKHRLLIQASLIMAVMTIASNKPYLGWPRHTWDPVLLGVLLVGVAIALRRWLSRGPGEQRDGFTPERILSSDLRSLTKLSAAAAIIQPFDPRVSGNAGAPPAKLDPGGGGRSGGGGGGGAF